MAATSDRLPHNRRQTFRLFTPGIPWYRDVRVLRLLAQVVFLIVFFLALFIIFQNLVTNLRASNLALDFDVYRRPFNIAITEGISLTETWSWVRDSDALGKLGWAVLIAGLVISLYSAYRQYRSKQTPIVWGISAVIFALLLISNPPEQLGVSLSQFFSLYFAPSTMARAFVTGIVNTLQVVIFSVVACTLLGVFAGIGLLSTNILVRTVAKVYVEIFRNTPLVVQLIFIYRALTLLFPPPRQSICSLPSADPAVNACTIEGNLFILNARGIYVPRLIPTDTTTILWAAILIGIVAAFVVRRWRINRQEQTGKPAYTWRFITGILLAALAAGWLFSGTPYMVNYPVLRGPNIQEGTQFTLGFASLFVGLTLYTGAFIADIVRAGIQSVPYGQIEAARSQGFSGGQVLSLVVLPQALRLIIPPLGNQYVNLGKNSSLGIAVAYVDTYRIAQLANNESGQAVPFFIALMLIYLAMSLILSFLTNLINRSTQLKTR